MDDKYHRGLKHAVLLLGLVWAGWVIYNALIREQAPGERAYQAAERYFEDGLYVEALGAYEESLRAAPSRLQARRGKARTLMQLERHTEAMQLFNRLLAENPLKAGVIYANRGILHDRLGHYQEAVADYEEALRRQPELAEGPGWMRRFLRAQPQKPPTIAERAAYLRRELAKPPAQRLLRVPQQDAAQRPYKQ